MGHMPDKKEATFSSKQDQIDAEIRGRIIAGEYRPGNRLPTWDALEARFGVSRLTIMRGIAALHEDGFLTAARSRGTFVVDTPPHLFNYALALPFWNSAKPPARFWRRVLEHSAEMQAAGPARFKSFFGFDWGYSGEELTRLATDAEKHRIAGIVAISHARFAVTEQPRIRKSGIPVVALTAVTSKLVCPTVGPNLPEFVDRAVAILRATGRKKVALLGDFGEPEDSYIKNCVAALENAGLECRPYWRASVPWGRDHWARTWAELVFRLPPADRPDALLIDDEHLCESAVAGVLAVTAPGEVPIVAHANFPVEIPSPPGVIRLGFDLPQMLGVAVRAIDALRKGEQPAQVTLLSPMLESEFLARRSTP